MLRSERDEPSAVTVEEGVGCDQKCTSSLLFGAGKRGGKFIFVARGKQNGF